MAASILNGQRILAANDKADASAVLGRAILDVAPKGECEKVTTYEATATKWNIFLVKLADYINKKFGAEWSRPPGMPY